MNSPWPSQKRFTIRTLLGIMVVLAMAMGWLTTVYDFKHFRERVRKEGDRVRLIESHVDSIYSIKQNDKNRRRGFMSGMNLEGCDFRNVTINAGPSAFQSSTFVGARLNNATITAGGSSFQSVSFDEADLSGAKLTATGSSFQIITFVNANLQGATLTGGNGAVFQAASFRGADLTGATVACSGVSAFSAVDVDSAIFDATDLSSIDAENLRTAYFSTPPTYDTNTKFPKTFDPKAAGWTLVFDQ